MSLLRRERPWLRAETREDCRHWLPQLLLALIVALVTLLASGVVRAQTLVLVHGYLGTPFSWESSGVLPELAARGWTRGGVLPGGLIPAAADAERAVYTVALPYRAPLAAQADQLNAALREVAGQRPGDTITLVGHSAGGVVARLALVRGGAGQVQRLITIAAPHLGTGRALQALSATDDRGLFGPVKRFLTEWQLGSGLYHELRASWPALLDLAPPAPGNLLAWLNVQPHPQIEYVSVLRSPAPAVAGDELVPGYSQDMNQVPALAGRAQVLLLPAGHGLSPADGWLLGGLLRQATAEPVAVN